MSKSVMQQGFEAALRRHVMALVRAGFGLALALAGGLASATHVSLLIDNLQPLPTVVDGGGGGQFYNLQTVGNGAHLAVTGGLFINDQITVGRRAVGLLGFGDDLVLLDAQAPTLVQIDPSQEAVPVQFFALDFYGDPRAHGLDPAALLAGFATNYLTKTAANLCPVSGDCAGTPDGFFDVTFELNNFPDSLRVAVRTSLVSEPGMASLVALALLGAFSVTRCRPGLTVPLA